MPAQQEFLDFLQTPTLLKTKVARNLSECLQSGGDIGAMLNRHSIGELKDFIDRWDGLDYLPSPSAQPLFEEIYNIIAKPINPHIDEKFYRILQNLKNTCRQ